MKLRRRRGGAAMQNPSSWRNGDAAATRQCIKAARRILFTFPRGSSYGDSREGPFLLPHPPPPAIPKFFFDPRRARNRQTLRVYKFIFNKTMLQKCALCEEKRAYIYKSGYTARIESRKRSHGGRIHVQTEDYVGMGR